MSVAAEIIEHLPGSAKRPLRIDDPLLLASFLEQTSESFGPREAFKGAGELKLALFTGLLEVMQEQAAMRDYFWWYFVVDRFRGEGNQPRALPRSGLVQRLSSGGRAVPHNVDSIFQVGSTLPRLTCNEVFGCARNHKDIFALLD